AGVGPICVVPRVQAKGVGRALMRHVVDHALKTHGPQVRLFQEAYNMTSLSLYTSIGFEVTEPAAILSVPPMADARTRPLTPGDVDAADTLCVATQKVSRRNELLGMIANGPAFGCVPHGRFDGARMTAFCVPGFFGFAAGETADDLLIASRVAVAALPPPLQRIILPTNHGPLFRAAPTHGLRAVKVGQLMAIGPYERPTGFWAPSISY
ncbi:MAG: GNAT family N-acetyltransferase, partial [Sphingomonas sp.]